MAARLRTTQEEQNLTIMFFKEVFPARLSVGLTEDGAMAVSDAILDAIKAKDGHVDG